MSRAVRSGIWTLLLASCLASPAASLTVTVRGPSPGLDQGFGYSGCPSCTPVYTLASVQSPIGTSSPTIEFASDLLSATEVVTLSTIIDVHSTFTSGAESLVFHNTLYEATVNASVTPLGGGLLRVQQSGAATGHVGGSSSAYESTLGGSGPVDFAVDVNGLICVVDATGTGTCGLTFGPTGFVVNDGLQNLSFAHTFDFVVPEPGLLAVLLVGAAVLGATVQRPTR